MAFRKINKSVLIHFFNNLNLNLSIIRLNIKTPYNKPFDTIMNDIYDYKIFMNKYGNDYILDIWIRVFDLHTNKVYITDFYHFKT